MKTFQEVLSQIQSSIGRIQDAKIREQVQSKFDSLPKDESKWVVKSFSGNLTTTIPASTNPTEIERIYRADYAFHIKEYYNGCDIVPEFTEKHSSSDIEFDTFYELIESQPNGDLGTAQKYQINGCQNGTSFDIQTFDTDNRKCKDANGNTKAGTYKRDTQYSFSESTLGKIPYIVISERINEYGINSALKRENHFTKIETNLIGGKITEIESKQTMDIEGESRKEKTKTIKTENGKDFEKTIKTESVDIIQNIVEKGTLHPGESLNLSKKGEKVVAVGSGVVVGASD
ncbi:MAG: hypothetical protein ACI4L6_00570 [Candidatus Onthoplasma sp.]